MTDLTHPTIQKPFFIELKNDMPPYSMRGFKNSQQMYCDKGKPKTRRKEDIANFLKEIGRTIAETYQKSEFDPIARPLRATIWSIFTIYTYDGISLPKLDVDNQWQSVQEKMMPHVVEDDVQFDGFYTQRVYTRIKQNQSAFFWLWVLEPNVFTFEQHQEFYRIHYNWIWSRINREINHGQEVPIQLRSMLDNLKVQRNGSE